MNRALAGFFLAALTVIGLPVAASAASDSPVIFASSTSYSSQPRPYSIQVFNRLDGGRVTASVGGSGMSCRATAAPNGVGRWTCTAGSRLSLGSKTVAVTARGDGKVRTASKRINVSSRFGISSRTSPGAPGGSFSVSGRYDHLSGTNDFRVSASVYAGGVPVLGQRGVGCSTSGGSYTCSLRSSATGNASSYSVTVTESGAGSRSASTTVAVPVTSTPSAPVFTSKSTIGFKKQPATITGRAAAFSAVQVVVDPPASGPNWAKPTTACTANGSGTWSCKLPKAYKAGTHKIFARAISQADATRISPTSSFTLTVKAAAVPKPKPTPSATPTPTPTPTPAPVVEPTPEPTPAKAPHGDALSDLLALLILGLAVLALVRPGPLSQILALRSSAFSDADRDDLAPQDQREPVGPGDNSPTWAAFGHEATDYWSRTAPGYVARYSQFLGRLSVDGVVIRAIFGSAWWLLPLGGIALGVASANQTAYLAVPPSLGLLIGVVVLSCFDAFAGFLASLAFGVMVVGDFSAHGLATILAVGFLWTALPLVAGAIRPLRRSGRAEWTNRWDRAADVVLASLLAGWLALVLARAFDAIADTATGIPADAGKVALAATLAVAARILLGQAADLWYPERLRFTEINEDLPEPHPLAEVGGSILRVLVFAFLGHVFIGGCWQWVVGVLLFLAPEVLAIVQKRSLLAPTLDFPLPRGLTQVFGLVILGTIVAAVAVSGASSDQGGLRAAFVAVGLVPTGYAVLRTLQDPDPERDPNETSWDLQLAGAGILLTTVILALHGYDF